MIPTAKIIGFSLIVSMVLFTTGPNGIPASANPSVTENDTTVQDLLVSSFETDQILRYNGLTGAFKNAFVARGSGGLDGPTGFLFGPDKNLYVSSTLTSSILCYNGKTGDFIKTFVPTRSGNLQYPRGLAFGTAGDLFVASEDTNSVLRYHGTTGAFISTFVSNGSGGLNEPRDIAFGPDGNLYVCSLSTNSILRYHGQPGAFIDAFVPSRSGNLSGPRKAVFRPDGHLYVSSYWNQRILRYNASTGAFVDEFIAGYNNNMQGPIGFTFGPDENTYVTSEFTDSILRYNGTTGAFMDTFVTLASGGLDLPVYVEFTLSDASPASTPTPTLPPTATPYPTATETPSPTPVPEGFLKVDLDRNQEGIQNEADRGCGETVAGSLVLTGPAAYRGHTVRIQIDPAEAVDSLEDITFSPGALPGSGMAFPNGGARTLDVNGVRFMHDILLQTMPPYTDVTDFPAIVFNFDIRLSQTFEGEARLHLITQYDNSVPSNLTNNLSILVPSASNPDLSDGIPIDKARILTYDADLLIELKPLNVTVSAAVEPALPYTLDDLQCAVEFDNLGGYPNLDWSYRWFKNGSEITEPMQAGDIILPVTGTLLSHLYTAKGDTFYCLVRVTDGIATLDTPTAAVTIQNSPPPAPVVQILPPNPHAGQSLGVDILVYSVDPDGDTVAYRTRWYESTDDGETWVHKVEHDNQPSVDGIYIQEEDLWRVEITPYEVASGSNKAVRAVQQLATGEIGWDQVFVGLNSLPTITVLVPDSNDVYALPSVNIRWKAEDADDEKISVDLFYGADPTSYNMKPIATGLSAEGHYLWTPPGQTEASLSPDLSGNGKIDSEDFFLFADGWKSGSPRYYIFARAWDEKKAKTDARSEGTVIISTDYPGDADALLRMIRGWHRSTGE